MDTRVCSKETNTQTSSQDTNNCTMEKDTYACRFISSTGGAVACRGLRGASAPTRAC